jgi:hypothetical protein
MYAVRETVSDAAGIEDAKAGDAVDGRAANSHPPAGQFMPPINAWPWIEDGHGAEWPWARPAHRQRRLLQRV